MERSHNTLTANEVRNDRDTLSPTSAFIEDGTALDDPAVASPTARTISRKKLTIFVSIAAVVGVIILVILIPILGLRKSG